ncbi:MAG TPA: Crp/Fnr family transcriptional regulator [Spirochaetia bacterium]|nr:Crp/Fnr family transcriptional regulator [Spirochaetia bacterium]
MAQSESADWFERLPRKTLREAERFLRRVTLRREKALYYQEDDASAAYCVRSGELRLVKWRPDGASFVLGKGFPGDWLGLAEAVMEGPYLCDAVSVSDSELTMVRSSDLPYLMGIEGLGPSLARELAGGYYPLHDVLESGTPELRIVHHLSRLLARSRDAGHTAGTPLLVTTQEEIAEATGLSRETVNRHLNLLQKDGMIEVLRGKISVTRPGALLPGWPAAPASPGGVSPTKH